MDTPSFSGLEFQLKKFLKANNVGTLKPPAWILTENGNSVHLNISWSKVSNQSLEDAPKPPVKTKKYKSPSTKRRDKSRLQKWLSLKTSSPEQDADVLRPHEQKYEAPDDPSEVLVKAPACEKAGEHIENSNSKDEERPPALNKAGERNASPPASDILQSSPTISDSSVSTTSTTCSTPSSITPSNNISTTSVYQANDEIVQQSPEPVRRSRGLQGQLTVSNEILADLSRSQLLLMQLMADQYA